MLEQEPCAGVTRTPKPFFPSQVKTEEIFMGVCYDAISGGKLMARCLPLLHLSLRRPRPRHLPRHPSCHRPGGEHALDPPAPPRLFPRLPQGFPQCSGTGRSASWGRRWPSSSCLQGRAPCYLSTVPGVSSLS